MGRILIQHADILSLSDANDAIHDGEVAIDAGRIVSVGATPDGFTPDETIDAAGKIVMPGLFNAHTQGALALLRGWFDDLWAGRAVEEREIYTATGMTEDDVYWGAALAVKEFLHRGIVGFADRFFHMDRVLEVVQESGIRANLAWCTYGGSDGEVGVDLPGIEGFVERCLSGGSERIIPSLGPHSPSMCPPQFLARTSAIAARLGVGIHVQVAETDQQVRESLAAYDLTPVQLLDRNGVFDVPVLAAGLTSVTPVDLEILGAKRPTVVVCPQADTRRGTRSVPVGRLLAEHIPVAIGTGAALVTGRMDLLEGARLLALARSESESEPDALGAVAALRLATMSGAHALGFRLSGELHPGRNADLVLVETMTPHGRPGRDTASELLYCAADDGVTDVMIAGRWVMRGRRLLTMDEARIDREAEARAYRLAANLCPSRAREG